MEITITYMVTKKVTINQIDNYKYGEFLRLLNGCKIERNGFTVQNSRIEYKDEYEQVDISELIFE